jgi:hypothetical protein
MVRPVKKGLKYYAESAGNLFYGTAFTTIMLLFLIILSPTVFIILTVKKLKVITARLFKKHVEIETKNC